MQPIHHNQEQEKETPFNQDKTIDGRSVAQIRGKDTDKYWKSHCPQCGSIELGFQNLKVICQRCPWEGRKKHLALTPLE